MRRWLVAALVLAGLAGCMETRHVRRSGAVSCHVGGCGPAVTSDFEHSERRWCGPWVGQPSKVQP
jgi:hypothetical protein